MVLNLFGYNGVFELDQKIVNELLATFLYEQHLVQLEGKVTDGDFISLTSPVRGGDLHLYLELARPYFDIQTRDGSNLVTLHLPFADIGIFIRQGGQTRRITTDSRLALALFDVSIQKVASGLTFDFSQLTGASVGIQKVDIRRGPTGIGGIEEHPLPLLADRDIENALSAANNGTQVVTAQEVSDLRNKVADFLRNGGLGLTSVPIGVAGLESALVAWDLLLFGNATDRDFGSDPGDGGADLLLFQDPQHGRGIRTQAGETIPPAPENPQYGWSLGLSSMVLQDDIKRLSIRVVIGRKGIPQTAQRIHSGSW